MICFYMAEILRPLTWTDLLKFFDYHILKVYFQTEASKSIMYCQTMGSKPFAWIITYSKCSNCRQVSKFLSNFGCLFTLSVCFKQHGKLRLQKNNKAFNLSHFNLFDLKQRLVFYNNAQPKKKK